jgi:hypothetical protein
VSGLTDKFNSETITARGYQMRYFKYFSQFTVVFSLALTAWIFYTWYPKKEVISQTREVLESNENKIAEEKSTLSSDIKDISKVDIVNEKNGQQALDVNFRSLASQIEEYKDLPTETDKDWVLENAENSLRAGLINHEQLPAHISELSSVRMFTVLDRTSPYTDSESFDQIEQENEEGL